MIWSNSYLEQLNNDAGNQITTDLNCIYNRVCFTITSGTSVYTLPSNLRSLLRITWRGYKLEPVNWEQFVALTPGTVFLDGTNKLETTISRPFWYTIHPTNLFDIRFFPTPNESFTNSGDPFSPDNGPKCILSFYQKIDTSILRLTLPNYIDRRTRKAYVLWQAFASEGKGQDLRAAEYYRSKYFFLIERFRMINQGCYVSKRYSLGQSGLTHGSGRWPRPILPPNFERVY